MNTTEAKQDLLGRLRNVATVPHFRELAIVLHHALAFTGLVAVVLILMRGKALFFDEHAAPSAAIGSIRYDGAISLLDRADDPDTEKYRALANYVSRKYRIAPDATEQFVGAAYDAGRQQGLDPLLILAVMAVESRFNPVAESLMGAKGLMQVIPRHHLDKLLEHGGEEAVLDPMINIALGARILKEYVRRTGSLEAGLQFYNGALADPSSQYAQKVFAEKERLQQAVRQFGRPGVRSSV
jgi:soluble lytic murein transglycosylase-like protein